jgi:type IV pilus assembly protein PilM
VDNIVLAGGCAAIPSIDVMVQERTQVHTIVANPFHGMTMNNRLKKQQVDIDAPAMLIACGLAMRGLSI